MRGLGHVKTQGDIAHGGLLGVVRQSSLGVEGQTQDRRCALFLRGQDQTPRQGTGHKTMSPGMLQDIAHTPGRRTGPQMHSKLRVVAAGKSVEFTCPASGIQHVGHVGHPTQQLGEGLNLLGELGELNVVQRPCAIGQLHARLHLAVALPRHRKFPLAGVCIQAFDQHGLAARSAAGRQMRQEHFSTDGSFQGDGRNGVNQGV